MEKDLWRKLKRGRPKSIFLQRLETKYPIGLPDVLYMVKDRVGFIELKEVKNVKPPYRVDITNDQVIFMRTWVSYGGRAFIMMAVKGDVWLRSVGIIQEDYRRVTEDVCCAVFEKRIDWAVLEGVLWR